MNELLKKLGDYFVENQRVADIAEIQETFEIQSRGTVLQAIKQLNTVGLLDDKNNVLLNSAEFEEAMAEHNKNFPDITISRELINEENDKAIKTRVPGTFGDDIRYMWSSKDNITEINGGKTLLTFIDLNRDYKLYGKQNEVVQTMSGSELYSHYSEVGDKVRSRLNTQNKENGFVLGELGDGESFSANRDVSPMAKAVTYELVFELTDMLAKLEDEHSVPQEERITDWLADYGMNIPRGGINSETVNILQNRIAELSSQEKVQETLQQENLVKEKTSEPLRSEAQQSEQRPKTVDLPVKTSVLAGVYDRAMSNVIALQDKNTKLAIKNNAAVEKLNRTRSFIERCDSLISSAVLPSPVNGLLKIISEQQHEKETSLENKISSRNLKIQKNVIKIQKNEQKIDTYKKLDTFLQNMKSPDGRRENFILGLSEFKDISIKQTTKKLAAVTNKIAAAQNSLNTTRFIQEKMKLQNKLESLNGKKLKLETKLDKLNQFDEKINAVKSASEQAAENIVSKSYDGIVNSIAENPAEFAKNPEAKVVDVCEKTIDSEMLETQKLNKRMEQIDKRFDEVVEQLQNLRKDPEKNHDDIIFARNEIAALNTEKSLIEGILGNQTQDNKSESVKKTQPQKTQTEKKSKSAFPMSRKQIKKNAQTIAHNKSEQPQNKNRSHGQEL